MSRKGWCPGALRPMPAGDGLLLRLRPRGSMLSADQLAGLAELAARYGSGAIDLGSRAALQLRGVTTAALPDLHQALADLALLDSDPAAEARRNIITTPLWQAGDATADLITLLEDCLQHAPDLPPKFGFALDTGSAACLQLASADLRIEQSDVGLILRPDGSPMGQIFQPGDLPELLRKLLHWFVKTDCPRMALALRNGHAPPLRQDAPPRPQPAMADLLRASGLLFAPFGAASSQAFRELGGQSLRLTPWRAVRPDSPPPGTRHWLQNPDDARLRVDACPGAPHCSAASVTTRDLAVRLASLVPPGRRLHLSGCAKGCARATPADVTLTGRDGHFDLILQGRAGDAPAQTCLAPHTLAAATGGHFAPPV
ncbi:hypothetical protein [Falsigemmobacter faecalis]|uniref:Nitrite/Sulfite reductase ferredoxin-like domain-containing protein n=1 Tax=Falsigemmobacter faecalis TaxID=2488730 RepID=A0A3P3DEI8_9RHOB|nr:hypothetical protein [Falsigemmobacter faecalis]RRH72066.1 hypothetical protein EG244_15680 [Falsigemmobacter faecalis]